MFNTSKKNIILFVLFIFFIGLLFFYWKNIFPVQEKNLNTLKYEKINIKNPKNLKEIEQFIIQNENIFGTLTALSLAKKYALSNDLDKAFIQLNNSLKYTKEENLKNILKLNMAKIQIQKHQNKKAINILKTMKNHNWDNIIENMKGDIFMNINNKKEAIKFWEKSLLTESSNASREIINMKIHELKEKNNFPNTK